MIKIIQPDNASRGGVPVRGMVDRSAAEVISLLVSQVVPGGGALESSTARYCICRSLPVPSIKNTIGEDGAGAHTEAVAAGPLAIAGGASWKLECEVKEIRCIVSSINHYLST